MEVAVEGLLGVHEAEILTRCVRDLEGLDKCLPERIRVGPKIRSYTFLCIYYINCNLWLAPDTFTVCDTPLNRQ